MATRDPDGEYVQTYLRGKTPREMVSQLDDSGAQQGSIAYEQTRLAI